MSDIVGRCRDPLIESHWKIRHEAADEIERLRARAEKAEAELETERSRLAACGVVAMADTSESATKARDMKDEYKSASCDDVARRVDECMRLRAELAAIKGQEPVGILLNREGKVRWNQSIGLRIGAALYAQPVASVADKDAETPTVNDSLIVAANKGARLSCVKDLIEVVRMPNAEWVADAHNAAVKKLRAMAKGE